MKKTLITVALASAALSMTSAFADYRDVVTAPSAPYITAVPHVEERNEEGKYERSYRYMATTTALTRMKANGDRLIKERLNSLASNRQVISSSKLTDEQKLSLTLLIDNNVTALTALRTSIASSTDASSTKALVNSVYTNFRVYGILIPQIRLEKRVYDLENHGLKIASTTFPKIQTNIDENKAKGRDVTAWQKNLDDAKALVAKDLLAVAALSGRVAALKPADYGTTTKASIESINKELKAIEKDFNSINKLVRKPTVFKKLTQPVVTSMLSNTSWTWVSSTLGGVTTQAPAGDKFVLTFGKDKQLSSSTDCNRLMGKYEAGTSSLSVGPLAMTMMFCDGSKEGEYAAAVSSATSYRLDGTMLTLTSASGTMMFHKKN